MLLFPSKHLQVACETQIRLGIIGIFCSDNATTAAYALAHTAHAKEYLNIKTKRTYRVFCFIFFPPSWQSHHCKFSVSSYLQRSFSVHVPAVTKPAALRTPCPQITRDAQTRVQKDLGDAGEGTPSQHLPSRPRRGDALKPTILLHLDLIIYN